MPSTKARGEHRVKKAPKREKQATGGGEAEGYVEGCAGSDGEEAEFCVDCGRAVLMTQQGLECDSCGFWHHAVCEKVSDEVYAFLHRHSDATSPLYEPSILWYCKKCICTTKKMSTTLNSMQEHHLLLEEKVNKLTSSLSSRMDEMAELLTKSLKGSQPAAEDSQKRVEEKVDKLAAVVEKQGKLEGHAVLDCVDSAVRLKLQEDRDEAEEIDRRRNSVIIHGLLEPLDSNPEDRKKTDEDSLTQLLHHINCDEVSINAAIRLGKRDDTGVKSRPLKIGRAHV